MQRTPSPRRRGGENGAAPRRDRAPMRSPVNSDGSPPIHCAPRIVIPNPHLAPDFRLRASSPATRKAATSRPRPLSACAVMDGSRSSTWRTGSLRSSGDGWLPDWDSTSREFGFRQGPHGGPSIGAQTGIGPAPRASSARRSCLQPLQKSFAEGIA